MSFYRHTTAYYLVRLQPTEEFPVEKTHSLVSKWETEGLFRLCAYLQSWLQQSKDGSDSPSRLENYTNVVNELENVLKREGFVCPTVDPKAAATVRLTFRSLSTESPDSQWPTVAEGEDSDAEIAPEDTNDNEIDPLDEDDTDFQVEVITSPWSKRQRTPATKKLERKPNAVKRSIVIALPKVSPTSSMITKSNSSIRARLLKKCGLDPRIPLPSPKPRPKEDC